MPIRRYLLGCSRSIGHKPSCSTPAQLRRRAPCKSRRGTRSDGADWNVDVRHVFNFTRAALTTPLDPGSVVISLSSGAALRGSPLSGGYAGAKATIRFISSYAGSEAHRIGSNIRFVAVLPNLTPATELGQIYAEAVRAQAGVSVPHFLERFGGTLSADRASKKISDLAQDDSYVAPAYLLTAGGLQPLD